MLGKPGDPVLHALVLVLVVGFSRFVDYEDEDDDENEHRIAWSEHALGRTWGYS